MLIDVNGDVYEGRAHNGDAGHDLKYDPAGGPEYVVLGVGERALLGTGTWVEPGSLDGGVGLVFGRSGLAAKHGITLANSVGVVDAGYRGEIKVCLINHGEDSFIIEPGMRIAQFVALNLMDAAWLGNGNERGEGGHGSSGA